VEVRLTPLGQVDPAVLEHLVHGLPGYLPLQPVIASAAGCSEHGQSGRVLDALLALHPAPGVLQLAITERLLLGEDGRPVFGEATISGPVAVLSLAPLRADPAGLLPRRALVSALHELGHMAGAEHCPDRGCVMYPSRTIAETDAKGPAPCGACDPLIRAFFAESA
jgi:archaemetzincin